MLTHSLHAAQTKHIMKPSSRQVAKMTSCSKITNKKNRLHSHLPNKLENNCAIFQEQKYHLHIMYIMQQNIIKITIKIQQ